ncbi:MAG: sulfurtransferase-like selenium metabolism protein YedF [candidate division Zixibacteria bacterium]|nr:sulfurtransferase-like selenium metabolism protein YedF [candidate division Zixibacteria bacterium]
MGKVIIVNNEKMGQGENELTTLLMGNFLRALISYKKKPDYIIFYGAGVKLVIENSPYLETLVSLENMGVELLSCSTCLNFYGIADKVRVGKKSNMAEIVEVLITSEGTITI